MRPNRWLTSGAAALALPLFVFEACSSSSSHQNPPQEQPGEDATTKSPDEQSPPPQREEAGGGGDGACDLKAAGLEFSTQVCQDCMQAQCCALTIACSITDKTCAELQQCYIDCPKGGGGGGDGGKEGGGDGGGGSACRAACEAKYPGAVQSAKAYNDCITGPCGPPCVGGGVPDAGADTGPKDGGPKDAGDAG
jgi:hypothetical protein